MNTKSCYLQLSSLKCAHTSCICLSCMLTNTLQDTPYSITHILQCTQYACREFTSITSCIKNSMYFYPIKTEMHLVFAIQKSIA